MSNREIYISAMGYGLGDIKQSVAQAEVNNQLVSAESLLSDCGFKSHHRCSDKMTTLDLARAAIDDLITRHPEFSPDAIDVIINATCLTLNGNIGSYQAFQETRDVKHLMNFPVSHIQADYGMNNAFIIGTNQTACTSLLNSIRIGKSLLQSEADLNQVLCITADRFPADAIYEQSFNLISDGAAACLLQPEQGDFKVLSCHHISNGAMAQANDDETAGFYFNYSVRLIREALAKLELTPKHVDWVVPQNTNIKAWKVLSSLLGIPYEKVLMPTREDIGHCISGDNIINLMVSHQAGNFKTGDIIIMPMAGFGLNWSCITMEKTAPGEQDNA